MISEKLTITRSIYFVEDELRRMIHLVFDTLKHGNKMERQYSMFFYSALIITLYQTTERLEVKLLVHGSLINVRSNLMLFI